MLESDIPGEWETLLRLTGIVTGQGADADVAAIDAFVAGERAPRRRVVPGGPVGPERLLDMLLRTGRTTSRSTTSRPRRTGSTSGR